MITRAVGQLWLVTGRVRRDVDTGMGHRRWMEHVVLLEHSGFPDEEIASAALLHNYSSQPHVAEVHAIEKFEANHSIKLTA